jgi:DNA (cytosine-5)-methyltransferase 1
MIKPECINLYDENGKETSFQDRIYRTDKISAAITASFRPFYLVEKKMTGINLLGGLPGHERKVGVFQTGYSVYGTDGISPTVLANGGGVRNYGRSQADWKSFGKQEVNPNTNRVYDKAGLSPALNTMQGGNRQPMIVDGKKARYRIRKLTPRETWRLMGFSDSDFDKAQAVNSNTQLYKEAGNSIVKDVLMAIFRQMNIKGVETWNR